jgi:hypothetical protein
VLGTFTSIYGLGVRRPQAVVLRGLARHETQDSTEVPPAPERERERERERGRGGERGRERERERERGWSAAKILRSDLS